MARKAVDEYCMLCDQSPCACNKKVTKKVARPSAPRLAPPAVEQPARTAPTLAGFRPPKVEQPARVVPKVLNTTPVKDEDDPALRRAVTIFVEAGMVSNESIIEHRNLIDLTDQQILKIRASEWMRRKERRDHRPE